MEPETKTKTERSFIQTGLVFLKEIREIRCASVFFSHNLCTNSRAN